MDPIHTAIAYVFFISYLPEIMHLFIVFPNEFIERVTEINN
tara:strand:+ start:712 stop:834 length:123 start_codon:yes stop_codon:yes gene_type:complete